MALFKNEYREKYESAQIEITEVRQELEQKATEIREQQATIQELTIGGVAISPSTTINGVSVSRDKVLRIPTVEACINLISETIAMLPIELKKEKADGSMEPVKLKKDDKRLYLLNRETDENTDARTFLKAMVTDYLLDGQAFAYKRYDEKPSRVAGETIRTLKELNYLKAEHMLLLEKYHDGIKHTGAKYQLTTFDGAQTVKKTGKKFDASELLRIVKSQKTSSFEGDGIYKRGAEIFAQAIAQLEMLNSLLNTGAMPAYVVKSDNNLNADKINNLRNQWSNLYSGVKNTGKTVILEKGMDIEKLSMNLQEMQMFESAKQTASEIVKLFSVPESMISSAANKYGSVEANSLHFYKHCLAPILTAFEQAFDRQLLTEKEKEMGLCFRFNPAELLRTTQDELADNLVKLVAGGLKTPNEARKDLDLQPVEGGNDMRLSLGTVSQDTETGETTVHNMDGGSNNQNEKEVVADE